MDTSHSSGFDYAYGWNVHYQRIMGVCWNDKEGFLASQRAWGWAIFILIFVWIPQTASVPFLLVDLNSMINCLVRNVPIGISLIKIVLLQYHRRATGCILLSIVNDWKKPVAKEDLEIMLESAKISRLISIISFWIGQIAFFEYVFSRLWISVSKSESVVDPRLSSGLLVESYFPFDTSRLTIVIPIWLCQFFGLFLGVTAYGGADSFFTMIVLHLCGQLRIIRRSLKYLVDDTTKKDRVKYWQNVTAIVERHEQLNKLSFVIRDTFSLILLVQMLVCSVMFCFLGYVVFTTLMDRNDAPLPIFDLTYFLIYLVYTLLHLFMYCYFGDMLLVESTSLSDEFYDTEWYNLAPREAKAFLFVCHRADIPLEIKAGKFCTFNLQLFNSIMKNSMGYLSMLMAMKERLID